MVNEQTVEGKWTELSGRVQQEWGRVTEDDVAAAEGRVETLIGIIQQRSGESRERIEARLDEIVRRLGSHSEKLRRKASASMEETSRKALDYADRASHAAFQRYGRMHGQYDDLSAQARRRLREGEVTVRRHPVRSLGVAFGAGMFAGLVVGLCCRRSGD